MAELGLGQGLASLHGEGEGHLQQRLPLMPVDLERHVDRVGVESDGEGREGGAQHQVDGELGTGRSLGDHAQR